MTKDKKIVLDFAALFWTIYETAFFFRKHRNTILRWVKERGFPPVVHWDPDKRDPAQFLVPAVLRWALENQEVPEQFKDDLRDVLNRLGYTKPAE